MKDTDSELNERVSSISVRFGDGRIENLSADRRALFRPHQRVCRLRRIPVNFDVSLARPAFQIDAEQKSPQERLKPPSRTTRGQRADKLPTMR
jgi:hypothetical protein